MKVYKYKCSDCGSTRFEKVENGYKCKYCGNIQDVIIEDDEKTKEPEQKEEPNAVAQTQEKVEEQEETSSTIKPSVKQTLINFIVCLIGGWFGLHKFLKGEIFWGIVYVCTFGLFSVGYILDCIFGFFELLGSFKAGEQ